MESDKRFLVFAFGWVTGIRGLMWWGKGSRNKTATITSFMSFLVPSFRWCGCWLLWLCAHSHPAPAAPLIQWVGVGSLKCIFPKILPRLLLGCCWWNAGQWVTQCFALSFTRSEWCYHQDSCSESPFLVIFMFHRWHWFIDWFIDWFIAIDDTQWPTIAADFCNGSRQSPININTAAVTENENLTAFTFTNFNSTTHLTEIENTGRTGESFPPWIWALASTKGIESASLCFH